MAEGNTNPEPGQEVIPALTFSVKDRVQREGGRGSRGVIEEIREETNTSATDRPRGRRYLIKVKWDSGTVSYFSPESLRLVTSQ